VRPGEVYAAAVSLSAAPGGPGVPPGLALAAGKADKITAAITWPGGERDWLSL
jgi:hypothetical protein